MSHFYYEVMEDGTFIFHIWLVQKLVTTEFGTSKLVALNQNRQLDFRNLVAVFHPKL